MATTAAELIEEKGDALIAERTGAAIGTVRVWKSRNRIPRSMWAELLTAFPDLTLDRLKELDAAT